MGLIRKAKDNYFILGDIDSRDYDMVVSCDDAFNIPERDVDTFEVPGRNGDLIVDNGRFKNIDITYEIVIEKNFPGKVNAFKRAIGGIRGYVRLEDSFDAEVYRMASVDNVKIKELGMRYNGGAFEITLNCKPQKFLKSGEEPICHLIPAVVTWGTEEENANELSSLKIPIVGKRKIDISVRNIGVYPVQIMVYEYSSESENCVYNTILTSGNIIDTEVNFTAGTLFWRISITKYTEGTFDGVKATIRGDGLIGEEIQQYEAYFAHNIVLKNPTGYRAKPLFGFNSLSSGTIQISNNDEYGTASEYYKLSVSGLSQYKQVWLDCDTQYMYDEDGTNVTNELSIVTAESLDGRSLVFPELGSGDIVLIMDTEYSEVGSYAANLVFIYPRWWTI